MILQRAAVLRCAALVACVALGDVGTAARAAPDDDKNNDPKKRWRAMRTSDCKAVSLEDMAKQLAEFDVVLVGEQHDDPETHTAELVILQRLHKRIGSRLVLGLEMFERDNQADVAKYAAGETDETTFRKAVRLWSNYNNDYRPMVEYARANKLAVVGTNAPASIVRKVGKDGLSATFAALTDDEKRNVAAFVLAPDDGGDPYRKRFAAVMGSGMGHDGKPMSAERMRHIYEAQCLRDDTMAESIAQMVAQGRAVLHINGSFHSDAGLGTAARTRWRLPMNKHVAVLKIEPIRAGARSKDGELAHDDVRRYVGEADFILFVPVPAASVTVP